MSSAQEAEFDSVCPCVNVYECVFFGEAQPSVRGTVCGPLHRASRAAAARTGARRPPKVHDAAYVGIAHSAHHHDRPRIRRYLGPSLRVARGARVRLASGGVCAAASASSKPHTPVRKALAAEHPKATLFVGRLRARRDRARLCVSPDSAAWSEAGRAWRGRFRVARENRAGGAGQLL